MSKKWILCFLLFPQLIQTADSPRFSRRASMYDSDSDDSASIEVNSKHMSDNPAETAQRVLIFLFGERPSEDIERMFTQRLQDSVHRDPSVRHMVKVIESSDSSDSAEKDPLVDIKKLMLEAVHEAVEEKHLQAAEAQIRLVESEKQVRIQKYKFYGAAATAVTSLGGAVTALLAYNLS